MATLEDLKADIGYHDIDIKRCCEKCAFYSALMRVYGNSRCGRCKYLAAAARADDNFIDEDYENVDSHAICKHFMSLEQMMQFKRCKSAEELIMTIDILHSADIDDLLLQEIRDGIGNKRKATSKMMLFADKIEKTLMFETHGNSKVMQRPLMLQMCNVTDNGMVVYVDKSDDFTRVSEYISENEQFVKRRSKMWKEVMM